MRIDRITQFHYCDECINDYPYPYDPCIVINGEHPGDDYCDMAEWHSIDVWKLGGTHSRLVKALEEVINEKEMEEEE
jgi:hypothetical protein